MQIILTETPRVHQQSHVTTERQFRHLLVIEFEQCLLVHCHCEAQLQYVMSHFFCSLSTRGNAVTQKKCIRHVDNT